MKSRFLTSLLLLVIVAGLVGNAQAGLLLPSNPTALVYVKLSTSNDLSRFASTRLPMYAMLDGGLLTGADQAGREALQQAGLTLQVLDADLRSGTYYLAESRSSRLIVDFSAYGTVLMTTSKGAVLRLDSSQADVLAQAGAELGMITLTPKPLPAAQSEPVVPSVVEPDPMVQTMIDQVTTDQVYTYDRQLAGELPVWVDGSWYTITTRYTNSGEPIQKATSYVGQHMANLGMDVDYHEWSNATNPDVIGEMPGLINPNDIFIIGGHLDDVSGAPGADDNASGSVATLLAADILSQYQWGCTLRFAFWTGEEQGLLGSADYAQEASQQGQNILGYLNLDMIAWNTIGSSPSIYLGYGASVPESLVLANLFSDVVDAYQINLLPVIGTNYGGSSDHGSFLQYGFPAILGIEGDDDFNPYYHSAQDTPAHTDPVYFTDYVKAAIATYAHMSGCLIPSGVGHLNGTVTAANGGAPIAGAITTAENGEGYRFSATTDASGYYSRTLLADTYTVTASAYSYLPTTISGVTITTDTVTTRDFQLVSAPTYLISGTVTESGSGLPLLAQVSFDGSPITVWSDPETGFYQAELPQGDYTMHVRSDLHRPQQLDILMDHDQTQNFALETLPCILLVDDDQDAPDMRSYYTSALDALGVGYDMWDTNTDGDPGQANITGYRQLLWYTGYPYMNTFNNANETAVASFLDAGGNFFLSSQDYLWEMHLTGFGQDYLHIASYQNDVIQTSVTGVNVFSGLGPYYLDYPFNNYSDRVSPDSLAQVSFDGNQGDAALSYAGDTYRTIFFGYPFETLPLPSDRQAVMERMVSFFGGCEASDGWLQGHVTDAVSGEPLAGVSVTAAPGKANIQSITDPSGYYTMTLPTGTYTVTAALDGYVAQSQPASIAGGEVTSLDFSLQQVCQPVSNLDFSWQPLEPFNGDVVNFTASYSGTLPIDFQWNFGDSITGTGSTTSHTYTQAGTFTASLSATNACGDDTTSKEIVILQKILGLFLPLINR